MSPFLEKVLAEVTQLARQEQLHLSPSFLLNYPVATTAKPICRAKNQP